MRGGRTRSVVVAMAVAAVVSLFVGAPTAHADRDGRSAPSIIGGEDGSEPYRFHAAMLRRNPNPGQSPLRCGGALIANKWVVTAAHCVASTTTGQLLNPADFKISLGSNDRESGMVHSISEFHRHPQWFNGKDWGHDIGLIELETPARPAPITSTLHPPGDEPVRMIGWGRTVEDDPLSAPRIVKEVDSKLLLFVDCKFGDEFDITPGEVCVELAKDGTAGPCAGDSGSPLLWKRNGVWRIVGVTSRSGGSGCLNTPTVYTTTDDNLDWITKVIKSGES